MGTVLSLGGVDGADESTEDCFRAILELYSNSYTTGKSFVGLKVVYFQQLNGAGEMNRTPDLLITNELLYRLSYTG